MRYAILGDVHGNLEALNAVLGELKKQNVDRYFCVGDVVGYGPDPGECLKILQDLDCVMVAGNHDYAAVGKTSIEFFNPEARESALWTREALNPTQKEFIENMDLAHTNEDFALVHATLHGPEMFNYILNTFDALLCFQHLTRPICFMGHSHVPMTFVESDRIFVTFEPKVRLTDGDRALVNVGSVGQPRDQDARAAFGIYDSEEQVCEISRIDYDIEATCKKIMEAGLPEVNAYRLRLGQ